MHRLRAGGHAVVSIGKLHFRSGDDDNGFAEEILPMYLANGGKGWPQGLLRNPLPRFDEAPELARDVGPGDSTYTEYDRHIAAAAAKWLGRYAAKIKNKPWALFVSFASPHYPLTAPKAFFDRYAGRAMPEPVGCALHELPQHPVVREMARFWDYDSHFDEGKRQLARRCYWALCSFVDDNIRRVLEALEDSGSARDTVVIYISDHGEMLGNHGLWTKSVMYEDAVGVPLIMAGPDILKGTNDTLSSLTDIAATVEDVVGLGGRAAEAPWQSRSLKGLIAKPATDRFILSQYHDGGSPTGFYMIRQKRWKYVHYAGNYPPQLFDMEADPDELNDLGEAPQAEGVRAALYGRLTEILDPDAVNAEAFADQARLLETYGGREAVLAMPGFNHTPVGS